MGNKQSSETPKHRVAKTSNKKSDLDLQFFQSSLHKLPFKSGEEIFYNIARDIQKQDFEKGECLIQEGEYAYGLYFINKGKCNVLSRKNDIVINELLDGDFFGEISSLYNELCTATVVTATRCELFYLNKTKLSQHALSGNLVQLRDWCISQKYLHAASLFLKDEKLEELIIMESMKGTYLFKDWSYEALNNIYKKLPKNPIELHPPNSVICFGDVHGDCCYLILKGKIRVFEEYNAAHKKEKVIQVHGNEVLLLHDEKLFSDPSVCYSIKTITPCQVVTFHTTYFSELVTEYPTETAILMKVSHLYKKRQEEKQKITNDVDFWFYEMLIIIGLLKTISLYKSFSYESMKHIVLSMTLIYVSKDENVLEKINDTREGKKVLVLLDNGVIDVSKVDGSKMSMERGDFVTDINGLTKVILISEHCLLGVTSENVLNDVRE